jgi:hypothetical protein
VPGGFFRCSSPAGLVDSAVLVVDAWVHVVCTWAPSSSRMYVDGALVAEVASDGGVLNVDSIDGVGVGMNSPSGDVLNGDLDDVRIYRRGLTGDEACWAALR